MSMRWCGTPIRSAGVVFAEPMSAPLTTATASTLTICEPGHHPPKHTISAVPVCIHTIYPTHPYLCARSQLPVDDRAAQLHCDSALARAGRPAYHDDLCTQGHMSMPVPMPMPMPMLSFALQAQLTTAPVVSVFFFFFFSVLLLIPTPRPR